VRLPISSRNAATARLAASLARVAPTTLTILLTGETGTGKSLVARRMHRASRPSAPFVVLDCGALPPTLIAAELFGHRAGAFTDATSARTGWLDRAGAGTIVFDRVDLLPGDAQTALLRVLDERRFVAVGSASWRPFAARVIATAGEDLDARIADGRLRLDLYHRLAGLRADLPPLRRRVEDIRPAATVMLRRLARTRGAGVTLTVEATDLLLAYPWPGNFRELEAALARAVLTCADATIGVRDLGIAAAPWPAFADLAAARCQSLAAIERLYALWVLAREDGNVSHAARSLGISRRTLIRWRNER